MELPSCASLSHVFQSIDIGRRSIAEIRTTSHWFGTDTIILYMHTCISKNTIFFEMASPNLVLRLVFENWNCIL